MFKIAICEDEKVHLDINKLLIKKWSKLRNIPIKIVEFLSAEEFIFKEIESLKFDCIILDIELKNINGIELANLIRKKDTDVGLIFITGTDKYISYGYDLDATHYLIKPIDQDKLFTSLDKIWKKIESEKNISKHLIIKKYGEITKIKISDILYCESFQHYVDVHTTENIFTVKKNLYDLEDELDKNQFIRCHKSYIVNVHYIKQIMNNSLLLDNDTTIPLSKKRKKEVKELYFNQF